LDSTVAKDRVRSNKRREQRTGSSLRNLKNNPMGKRSIGKKLLIGASSILLVGLAVPVGACWAQQFNAPPGFAQGGNLGLPNTPMGYLGILTQEVDADKAKDLKLQAARGVIVLDVIAGSPAEKAGIKKGDVITEYNNQMVEGILELGRLVRETPPGHKVQLSIWRDGHAQKLSFAMGEAPAPQGGRGPGPLPQRPQFGNLPGAGAPPVLGIAAQDSAPNSDGVLVTNMQKDSAGEKAGLKAGDVITKIDGQAVRNLAELRGQLAAKRNAATITLGVVRNGEAISLAIQLARPPSQ